MENAEKEQELYKEIETLEVMNKDFQSVLFKEKMRYFFQRAYLFGAFQKLLKMPAHSDTKEHLIHKIMDFV
jgi:hypothetical protein